MSGQHVPGQQDEQDTWGYGFFHVEDPRDFFPNEESCSPDELTAHTEACLKAARGEPWAAAGEEHGPWTKPGEKAVVGQRPEGDGWVAACLTVRSFGIGTYLMHGDDAEAVAS